MKKFIAPLLLMALVAAFAAPANATPPQSATYVSGGGVIQNVPHPNNSVPRAGVGGYKFPPAATRPTKIHVADASGQTSIDVIISQGPNSFTGFCTNGAGDIPLPASTIAGAELDVYVSPVSTGLGSGEATCDGVATTGTITITYA